MEAGSSSTPSQCGDEQNTTMEETPHDTVDIPAPSCKAGDTSHLYSHGGELVEASDLASDAGSRSSSVDQRQVTLSSVKLTETGAGLISAPINGVKGIMADIAQESPVLNGGHTQVMENPPSSKEFEMTTDDGWTLVGGRKRKKLATPGGTTSKPSRRLTQNVTTQRRTFILRPQQRVHVAEIAPQKILEAVHKAVDSGGFPLDLRIRTKEDANTIAIDVWNPALADRILAATVVRVQVGKSSVGFQAYEAAGPNQVRGVIYTSGLDESPEVILDNLKCRTHGIISARQLGKSGKTGVITFEGNKIPYQVTYFHKVCKVAPYRPRAVVCYKCHQIGHKMDVCPDDSQWCGRCGRPHNEEMSDCQNQTPQCRNCRGEHVATDVTCPKTVKATQKMRRKLKPKNKRLKEVPRSPSRDRETSKNQHDPRKNVAPLLGAEDFPALDSGRSDSEKAPTLGSVVAEHNKAARDETYAKKVKTSGRRKGPPKGSPPPEETRSQPSLQDLTIAIEKLVGEIAALRDQQAIMQQQVQTQQQLIEQQALIITRLSGTTQAITGNLRRKQMSFARRHSGGDSNLRNNQHHGAV
ncbi:hypothetical protein HPB47_014711 [Ixodes persulcatus]|uniref:Uncharacterized protein n=1 Tax=Ixodes persulcatus TaxID=34615 RepID=A0AC60QVC1_IXOPE|nr:hypothetical protein HPB47_014711 [Ixodes persulcatus]